MEKTLWSKLYERFYFETNTAEWRYRQKSIQQYIFSRNAF